MLKNMDFQIYLRYFSLTKLKPIKSEKHQPEKDLSIAAERYMVSLKVESMSFQAA